MSTIKSSRLITATAAIILMVTAAVMASHAPPTSLAEAQTQNPSRPTGLTAAAAEGGGVELQWDDPQDSSITHYRVFRRNVSPGGEERMQRINSNTGSSATSYTDTTAEPGTRYRYRVQAQNSQGRSPRSAPANITTPTPPEQVQDVSATQEDAESPVAIAWTSLDEATAYQVERRTVTDLSADPVVVDAAASPHSDDSTGYDTEYLYRVRARNDAGYGEWSDLDRITTHREPSTPAAPARVRLSEETVGSIVITWQDPPGDEEVNGYRIYRKTVATNTDEQLGTTDENTTTYTDANVSEESWYTYWIVAHNGVGDSPESTWQSIETRTQTPGVPEAPASISLSEDTAGEVLVEWTAPDEGPNHTGYRVYRASLTGEATLIATVGPDTLLYTDTTVDADTWYRYHVRGYNDAGNGDRSRTRFIQTQE